MGNSVAELEAKERMILSQVDLIYNMNKEKLLDEALKISIKENNMEKRNHGQQ